MINGMFGVPVCVRMSGNMTIVLYVIMPISIVLIAIAMISRLRLTPVCEPFILNVNSVVSIKTPNSVVAINVNIPRPGLPMAVSNPPTAPAYVAPIFFMNSPLRASSTAWSAMNM